MLAGIGVQVLWSATSDYDAFSTLLASALIVLVVVLSAGDRLRVIVEDRQTVWGRGRSSPFWPSLPSCSPLGSADDGPQCSSPASSSPSSSWLAPFDIYAKRADPYLTPGWMALVHTAQDAEPYSRVFAIDAKLYPNTAGALGLQDIRVLDALYVERYWRYVRTFIQPDAYDRFTGSDASLPRFQDNPMFDALGVRAVLSKQDLANVPALRFLGRDRDTRVYENTNAYPRAWVVHDVHVVGGEDDAFAFLEARARRRDGAFIVNAFDPRHEAVVEHHGKTDGRDVARTARQADRMQHGGSRPGDHRALLRRIRDAPSRAACAGLLVLPDTYFPGWRATVNGREADDLPDRRRIPRCDRAERNVTGRVPLRAACLSRSESFSRSPGSRRSPSSGLVSGWRGRNRKRRTLAISRQPPGPIRRLAT